MGRTVPISAGQPLDTTRTAAGQVVTLVAAPGGGHAGGGLPHAGRTAAAADPRGPCRRRPAPALARFLTGTAEAGVYGPPGRVGPKYLPGRARLAAPVLAVRPPGGASQGSQLPRADVPADHLRSGSSWRAWLYSPAAATCR